MMPHRFAWLALLLLSPVTIAEERTLPYPPQAEVRAAFQKLLDRPAVPLNVKVETTSTALGFVTEHLSIASQKWPDGKEERVPMLLVRPEKAEGKLPVVIA